MLLSHVHVTALHFACGLLIKDKTVALGPKGKADASSSGSSVECFCPPICKLKKIIYINRAQGDVMWYEKLMEMHLGKSFMTCVFLALYGWRGLDHKMNIYWTGCCNTSGWCLAWSGPSLIYLMICWVQSSTLPALTAWVWLVCDTSMFLHEEFDVSSLSLRRSLFSW